jgi:glycosyltransferase involved in cell wall biosynthesis
MKSKINILYIFHESVIGGGSFCLLNIIKELDKEYFNPIVLLKEHGPLSTELEKIGTTVYTEKSLSTVIYNDNIFKISSLRQIYGVLNSLTKVKFWIKKTDADIVHLNTMMMYPYLWPAYLSKKKTVIHMREHWPLDEHQLQLKIAKRIIGKYADKIVAINQTSASILEMPDKTEIIYDWIDFENRSDKIDFADLFGKDYKSYKILLYLGGINWQKGALEIIDFFYHKVLANNVRLLLLGSDDKMIVYSGIRGVVKKFLTKFNYYRYNDKVKMLAQKDSRIVFAPSTYHVKSLIEQSYCLISFFTIPHANLPLAEAVFLGKPAIAARTPEAIEYCNKGKSALLFEINNKNDFGEKLLFALQNQELINSKSKEGMIVVRDLFDPIRNSALIDKLYKSLEK